MKSIQYKHSIRPYTSFNIEATTEEFVVVETLSELKDSLRNYEPEKIRLLGGGSNMLWTNDFPGRTLHVNLKGITLLEENDKSALIEVKAGENWHDFVLWSLDQNLGGIENLALIPGNVGSAPIQNIGAYGVELKNVMTQCTILWRDSLEEETLTTEECQLSYRNSIFKNEYKNKTVITSVQFKLHKSPHQLKTSYGAIEEELKGKEKTIQEVAQAVIRIRSSKLPDLAKIGNCGSFFKNPILSQKQFDLLKEKHPTIPHFSAKTGVKVPAAWLIDQLGYKGIRRGDAGVHPKQALVLVNYGNARGKEIWDLAIEIQKAVEDQFGIPLEAEVTCY